MVCEICGSEFVPPLKPRRTCSDECFSELRSRNMIAARKRLRENGYVYKGHPHTEETKKHLSRVRLEGLASGRISREGHPWSQETRDHLTSVWGDGHRKGVWNGMFGRKHREESKLSMSETKTRKILSGEYDKRKWAVKGTIESKKTGRVISYRSNWERRAIEILEADESVVSFRSEPMRIPYFRQEGERMCRRLYVPDLIVEYSDGRKVMIEVKPLCYVNSAVNAAKAAAAQEYCAQNGMTFEFWTQKELGL